MRIINIVDRLDRVNFGVWNAAIATAAELERQFGIVSEVWFPEVTNEAGDGELNGVFPRPLKRLDTAGRLAASQEAGLDPANDIIVTHGCWQYPTRWGRAFKGEGFAWMAVPHGMLESWSVSQKRLRKWVYFHLREKPALVRADRVRAVGRPEYDSLKKHFEQQLAWIANGVAARPPLTGGHDIGKRRTFLFMARLHHKKGIMELVRGWAASALAGDPDCRLLVAGPDDGALSEMKAYLEAHPELDNIEYLGGVYGKSKEELLQQCHFYILPSHSEGFPTSVLESMQLGLLPIISTGCNFPDVFEQGLGIQVSPDPASVQAALTMARDMSEEEWRKRVHAGSQLIEKNYTHDVLAAKQWQVYQDLTVPGGAG